MLKTGSVNRGPISISGDLVNAMVAARDATSLAEVRPVISGSTLIVVRDQNALNPHGLPHAYCHDMGEAVRGVQLLAAPGGRAHFMVPEDAAEAGMGGYLRAHRDASLATLRQSVSPKWDATTLSPIRRCDWYQHVQEESALCIDTGETRPFADLSLRVDLLAPSEIGKKIMRLFEIRGSFPDGQSLTLGDYMLCAGHTNMVVLVGSGVADSLNRVHRDIPVHLTEREPAYFASLVTDEWNPDPFVKRHLPGIDGSLVYAGDHGLTPTILDSLHGAWSNNGHHQPIDQGTFIETIGRHGRGTFTIVSSSAPPDLAIGFVNGPADDKDFLRAMR